MVKPLFLLAAVATGACVGTIKANETVSRTMPFHDHQNELWRYPFARDEAPPQATVAARVSFGSFVPYYPLPVGYAMTLAPYNKATAWSEISFSPGPEVALQAWLAESLRPGTGPERVIHAIVTDFYWYEIGGRVLSGRIATNLVVTDAAGNVTFAKSKVTAARAGTADGVVREHARQWLRDKQLLASLSGGAP